MKAFRIAKLLVALFLTFSVFAQQHEFDWVKVFPGYVRTNPNGMEMMANGDIVVVGHYTGTVDFNPGPGKMDTASLWGNAFLARYTTSGELVWQYTLNGTIDFTTGNVLALDEQDNIYISGIFTNTADFDHFATGTATLTSSNNRVSHYVAKYDQNGNYLWAKMIKDVHDPGALGTELSTYMHYDPAGKKVYLATQYDKPIDADPGVNVVPYTPNGKGDVLISQWNDAGVYQWSFSVGGIADDFVYSLKTDGFGNVYYMGFFEDTVDFDPSSAVAELSSGGLDTAYQTSGNLFFSKVSAAGQFIWAKSLYSPEMLQIYGSPVYLHTPTRTVMEVDEAGNVYLFGIFHGKLDLDPSAAVEQIESIGFKDLYLASYNPAGAFNWGKHIFSSSHPAGYVGDIRLLNDSLYIMGNMGDTMDFDMSSVAGQHVGLGNPFIANYSLTGQLNYVTSFPWSPAGSLPTSVQEELNMFKGVVMDEEANMYAIGQIGGRVDFAPGGDTLSGIAYGNWDFFLAGFKRKPTGIATNGEQATGVVVYPNPSSGVFNVQFENYQKAVDGVVEVYTALGIEVFRGRLWNNKQLDLSDKPPGQYLMRIISEGKVELHKLLIQ